MPARQDPGSIRDAGGDAQDVQAHGFGVLMMAVPRRIIRMLAVLALAPFAAQAQMIYKCVDGSGRTLSSDRPIPECTGRATKVFDRHGILRREIPAALTAQERQARLQQEESRKAEAAAAEGQARSDRALLMRFQSEGDILRERRRALEPLQEQARREQVALAGADEALARLEREMAALPAEVAASPAFEQRHAEARQNVIEHRKSLFAREADISALMGKYGAMLKRYRELRPVAPGEEK